MWRACNLTAFIHGSTSPVVHPFASCYEGPGFNPQGVLMWNRDSPVSIVSLHWWPRCDWSLWPHLRRALSWNINRPSCRQCDNSTWSHTALVSRFHARCRSSLWLHNRHSRLQGVALWRACNPTIFINSSIGPVVHPLASRHGGPRFNAQGGVLKWNRDSPVSVVWLQALLNAKQKC